MTTLVSPLRRPRSSVFGSRARTLLMLRRLLPALTFFLVLGVTVWLNPRVASYNGFTLMLGLTVPIMLATLAQMFIITIGDFDFSIGAFVSFVACVGATMLTDRPLLAITFLACGIFAYAAAAVVIELRRLPSIVVTLGLSFVWSGVAVLLLPSPGGRAPDWLHGLMTLRPPLVPLPFVIAVLCGLVLHWFLMRSSFGVLLRGAGGSRMALTRARWSILGIRVVLYVLAGLFGVLAGLSLLGLATSADANMASRYTLLSVAGVILGGGEFTGGRVSPIGAVFGALTLGLTATLLTFMRISPDWQIGAQGIVLIMVLALRVAINTLGRRSDGESR